MGFMTVTRALARVLPQREADDAAFFREEPDRIVLYPDPALTPSTKEPVRIFLGTEPGQYRAERVFIWSIERHRDASRRYEIYLMKDLAGFDRRLWLTGFSNYRLAIPHLAGGAGRAIYNDVDQQYLSDPGELFDMEMNGHGYLALDPRLTAVMLIDCERMKSVWTLDDARHRRRKVVEAKAADLWGPLPPEWHCREWEYEPDRTKCMHYTTIHTQPWQPFPELFVYQRDDAAEVWHEAEREADRARYEPFSLTQPSKGFLEIVDARRAGLGVVATAHAADRVEAGDSVTQLAVATSSKNVLWFHMRQRPRSTAAPGPSISSDNDLVVTFYNPIDTDSVLPAGELDGVVCTDTLEHLADDDVYWILDDLFARTRRFVHVTVDQQTGGGLLSRLGRKRRSRRAPSWWFDRLREVGERYPQLRWELELYVTSQAGVTQRFERTGGHRDQDPPRVWVLLDRDAHNTSQALALADSLGWPYETKPLRFGPMRVLADRLLGPTALDIGGARRSILHEPWPDVVIAAGRRTAPVTRWIGASSGGATRTVQLGGEVASNFDAVVTAKHLRLPIHPHRVETIAPLSSNETSESERSAEQALARFGDAARPWVVLTFGAPSARRSFDTDDVARIAEEVGRFAQQAGGTLFVLTGEGALGAVTTALERAVEPYGQVCTPTLGDPEDMERQYFACADAIVTACDDEWTIGQAVASTTPVYIHPVHTPRASPAAQISELVTRVAYSRPRKKKGTVRPQQGREYLCARLIERGIIRPPADLGMMREQLVERGVARPFGEPLVSEHRTTWHEPEDAAAQVRALLGWTGKGTGPTAPANRDFHDAGPYPPA